MPISILRNHLGGDHDGHVVFGERVGVNEHHVVAPKEHGLEISTAKRLFRQLLDLGVIWQRQPAAQVGAVEAGVAKRLGRCVALEPGGSKVRAEPERANANRCNGGILVQAGIGQSLAAFVGSVGNRCEADNLVEPRGHQPTVGKRGFTHRANGGNLVDVQTCKRLAAIECLFPDGADSHTGKADIDEIRAVIEGVQSDFGNGAILKAH